MSLKPFKAPRKLATVIKSDESSTSSTEELMLEEGMDDDFEFIVQREVKDWLAAHGPKLFGLEASKFNAQEAKKRVLKTIR